ncbi:protein containing DUF820, partial [Candidatus Magnetomorum sp. HK-1]
IFFMNEYENGGLMQTTLVRYDMKSVKEDNNLPFYQEYEKKNIPESKVKHEIDYDSFITEDDEPVDNMFSEHQQGLLTESLNTSWEKEEPYIVVANVGIYEEFPTTPIVPDVLLSLDVRPAKDIWEKKNRCYFVSVFGKPPELVIEIVSNKVGNEVKKKRKRYEKMGVKYYVIYDPGFKLYKTSFHAFKLVNKSYTSFLRKDLYNKRIWFDDIDIGLTIKKTKYKGMNAEWLRWCDINGKVLKSGKEQAVAERKRTEAERRRVETERKRAEA